MHKQILRLEQITKITGLSRSSIYSYIQQNTFPAPIKLGPKASGWLESEVQDWIESRIESTRG